MNKKRVIGITLDYETNQHYALHPWYALRENYSNAIAQFGAVPIMLPYHVDMVDDYLSMIDGLLITGGNFDISPEIYGEAIKSDKVSVKNNRSEFELKLARGALEKDIPILGICGGEQLLNVIAGGTLIQHIPDEIKNCLVHEQPAPKDAPSHMIKLQEDSKLYAIVGSREYMVNSTHHQAVKSVASNVAISAYAPDGVIEAIEFTDKKFVIGVEWHPEYLKSEEDAKLIKAFIDAC